MLESKNMKKKLHQKQKIKLISFKTKNLKKKQISSICKLKNSFWPWTIKKQQEWFREKVKKTDINNMLILNKKLIGYTLLRKRKSFINNKSLTYYYFDTFIIHSKFRNKGFGKILVLFNNKILKKLKKHSFLTCEKKTIPFYLKFDWKIIPKKKFKIMDHKPTFFKSKADVFGMTYSLDRRIKRQILYYLN